MLEAKDIFYLFYHKANTLRPFGPVLTSLTYEKRIFSDTHVIGIPAKSFSALLMIISPYIYIWRDNH